MAASVAGVTVSSVLPLMAPSVAEIVLVPELRAFARPPAPIVATDVLVEPQVTEPVRFAVDAFEYVPVAVNWRVVPATFEGLVGVTAMLTSVAGLDRKKRAAADRTERRRDRATFPGRRRSRARRR